LRFPPLRTTRLREILRFFRGPLPLQTLVTRLPESHDCAMPTPKMFFLLLLLLLPVTAAERVSDVLLADISQMYFAKQPQTGLPADLSYDEALRVQQRYVKLLMPRLGEPAGYKAGLVTPGGQKRFGIDHPVRGILLKEMLQPDGSKVPANYGTQPILEADLIVRVKDAGINSADSVEKAARHLSEVIAFIELADTTLATNPPIGAGALVASNVGARLGILGEARKFDSTAEFIQAFGQMKIILQKDGKELSRVSADGILGHPLQAVLWLVKDMNARGEKLKAGDLLSLGSPSPSALPSSGANYTLVYEGLPGGDLRASVSIQ
jgi:2-keto-4-pentenoate hydratase